MSHLRPTQKLYVHLPFGSDELTSFFQAGIVADFCVHPVGDGTYVGVILPAIFEFKEHFAHIKGVTILPPVHDATPLHDDHVARLAHAGVIKGDSLRNAAHKLHAHHRHACLDPDII